MTRHEMDIQGLIKPGNLIWIVLLLLVTICRSSPIAANFSLYGGGPNDGIVYAQVGGRRAPACMARNFDHRILTLLCRSLGFNSTMPIQVHSSRYTTRRRFFIARYMVKLNCSSTSSSDCELYIDEQDKCDGLYMSIQILIGLMCPDQDIQYRLHEIGGNSVGRLEAKINNTWGPVCSWGSTGSMYKMACKAMGLPSTDVRYYTGLYNGGDFEQGALEFNYCYNFLTPDTCQYIKVGRLCYSDAYVGLSCDEATEGKIMLTGDRVPNAGHVGVYHHGRLARVGVNSPKTSLKHEATVICRALNFSTNYIHIEETVHNSTLWINDLKCQGNESSPLECSGGSLDQVNHTTRGRSLTVSCDVGQDAVRLEEDGLLLVRQHGRWGTVCAGLFGFREAVVICKALNLPSSLASWSKGHNIPKRSGPIWWSSFVCESDQDSWTNCTADPWDSSCDHDDDVFITCDGYNQSSVQYRLAYGPIPNVGFVEMLVNNVWGSVCGTGFTDREARVVCRSLDLRTEGAKVVAGNKLPQSQYRWPKIWTDNHACNGSEESILACNHTYLGHHACHRLIPDVAAVYCGVEQKTEDFSLRIQSESEPSRLEIMMFGEWMTICSPTFHRDAAKTACAQLGIPHAASKVAEKGTFKTGTGPIWVGALNCGSNITELKRCFRRSYLRNCSHEDDVGVLCRVPLKFQLPHEVIVGRAVVSTIACIVLLSFVVVLIKCRKKSRNKLV